MEWLIAGGVSWLFGNLGIFIVLVIIALAYPRATAVAAWLIILPVTWGGSAIVLGFIGALCGIFPLSPEAFTIAAMITAVPSFIITNRLAGDIWSMSRGR